MLLKTIPRKIPQIVGLLKVKFSPIAKITINRFSKFPRFLKLAEVKMVPVARTTVNSASKIPQIVKLLRVELIPASKFKIKPVSKIPISKLRYPIEELFNIPNETLRVLDEFLNLPMWFTMPIIFVSSVALGAVISVLLGFVI